MDFSEQDVDVFEEYDAGDGAEAEAEGGGGASSGSSSPSSSSSSSAAASSSSSSGASSGRSSSGAAGGGDEEGADDGEYDSLPTRPAAGYRDEYEEEEEEARDLFGSDNDDYVKTPARSNYLVPVLPQIRNTNFSRGGRGGRGPPLLPRPGGHPGGRNNFGHGGRFSYGNGRNVEGFVSEMKLNKSEETLSRKAVAFQEPCEFACYSRVDGGDVYFDDRSLRLFKRNICDYVGEDLNKGFETFTEKRDLGSQGFGDLLACIRNSNLPLQNIHFVTYRNNLNKVWSFQCRLSKP
ncbi:hypothetical protein ACQ4PT_006469 [Festuca glaucescens]